MHPRHAAVQTCAGTGPAMTCQRMAMPDMIDFQTDPSRYRHWRIEYDGDVAYLIMDVDPGRRASATTSSSSIPTISASTSS